MMNQEQYIKMREALRPAAERMAEEMMKKHLAAGGRRVERRRVSEVYKVPPKNSKTYMRWDYMTEFYHRAIDMLAKKEGLI